MSCDSNGRLYSLDTFSLTSPALVFYDRLDAHVTELPGSKWRTLSSEPGSKSEKL